MPVEIKELIVRTNITTSPDQKHNEGGLQLSAMDRRRIIESCVEQVLKKVNKKKER